MEARRDPRREGRGPLRGGRGRPVGGPGQSVGVRAARAGQSAVLGPGDVSALGRCSAEGEKGKAGWAGRGEKLGRAFGPRVGLRFSFSISISNKV